MVLCVYICREEIIDILLTNDGDMFGKKLNINLPDFGKLKI